MVWAVFLAGRLGIEFCRVVPFLYLFPSIAPVQPGRQALPVTGRDIISVLTYSSPRVYVLLFFSVGVLSPWWCSSTSLRNCISVRRCRTRRLGPWRVWMLFLILFQVLLAIASLFQIQPCARQDCLCCFRYNPVRGRTVCAVRGFVVHSTAVIWIEGIPLQSNDGYWCGTSIIPAVSKSRRPFQDSWLSGAAASRSAAGSSAASGSAGQMQTLSVLNYF